MYFTKLPSFYIIELVVADLNSIYYNIYFRCKSAYQFLYKTSGLVLGQPAVFGTRFLLVLTQVFLKR